LGDTLRAHERPTTGFLSFKVYRGMGEREKGGQRDAYKASDIKKAPVIYYEGLVWF
jgi:hypothetical protein